MTNTESNKYNHSKLYKLLCIDNYYYIGCTTNSLSKRLGGHKVRSKKRPECRVYNHINKINWDNVKIVLISEHCFDNREQLLREETKLIAEHKDDPFCLNINRSKITEEERKINCKDYKINHKDEIKEWGKKYRECNNENIKQKMKEYRERNKEKIALHNKEYRERNIDKLKEKERAVEICICGLSYSHTNKARHERSKKHINYITNQKNVC